MLHNPAGKPELKAKKEKPAEIEKVNAAKGKGSDAGKKTVKNIVPSKVDVDSSDDSMSEDDEDDSQVHAYPY